MNMGKPKIDEKKCTGCGTCVDVCPVGCLEIDSKKKKAKLARPDDCIKCGACEASCPAKAIKCIL
jgi:NAD-dependent dihydropyrimidine dehydrogenase PreA subunit